MQRIVTAWVVLGLALGGCARDVRVRLPPDEGEPTGSVTVVFTRAVRDLMVSVNGVLVADRAHTARVRVTGVPAGDADVVVAAGAGEQRVERHMRVAVAAGRDTAIPLAAPDPSVSRTFVLTALSAVAYVLVRAVTFALP
ncbi:MAG: hypothetical protein D6689_06450 [Deltaproteobacteria bacterium]|nr:MAG: hypothetical protein D6689_06450 [Deltaproteobacteria bacterium]